MQKLIQGFANEGGRTEVVNVFRLLILCAPEEINKQLISAVR